MFFKKLKKVEKSLKKVEKSLFLIIQDNRKISSSKNVDFISKQLGVEINKNKLMYHLKNLKEQHVLVKNKQEWNFVDNQLKRYILEEIRFLEI